MSRTDDRRRSGLARWLLAFRLARREFRRHPWRHALVVLMITVPVLAAMVAFSAMPTFQRIDERRDVFGNYGADLHIWNGRTEDDPAVQQAVATLPPGSRTEVLWTSSDWLVTQQERPDGRGPELVGTSIVEVPSTAGATRFRVDEGRLPRDGTEIFLAGDLAEVGSWKVGDRIPSGRDDREFVVSGIGAARDKLDEGMAVVADVPESYWLSTVPGIDWVSIGTRADAERDQGYISPIDSHRETFIWLPAGADAAEVAAGFDQGGLWASVIGSAPMDDRLAPAVALVFAALSAIVAIVSSAAFAIASRRQLRSVGLLSTAGADPATIRAALVLQGAFPGLVAAGLALVVGLVGSRVLDSGLVLESTTGVEGASVVVAVGGVALAVVLGVLAGTGAAWLPARTASRVPVLSALAGRRPVGPVPTKVPLTGLVFVAAGAIGLAVLVRQAAHDSNNGGGLGLGPVLMIVTVLCMLFGLISLAPTLVATAGSLSLRVTGTARIALRGLARHRGQSAAAVAAVAICLAVPVGVLTTKASAEHEERLDREASGLSVDDSRSTVAVPSDEGAVSVRSSSDATTVQVMGALSSPAVDDLITRVEEVIGPVAKVSFIAFNDGADGWYTVAAMSTDDADANLAPWAAQQLREGGAVALLGEPGPVVLDDDVTSLSLEAVGSPDGARTRIVPGLDADYLVPDTVLQEVAVGRPPLDLALIRPQQLSTSEASRLEDLMSLADTEEDPFAWPTLEQLQAARQTNESGSGEVGAAAEPSITDPAQPEVWLGIDYASVSDVSVDGQGEPESDQPYDEDRAYRRWLLAVAVVTGILSLLVLTITLSLRAVDSVDDHRAAVAAGAAPARIRRQHAFEGAVLASLGALLALPLGWLPVTAVLFGEVRRQTVSGRESSLDAVVDRIHLPGWELVPILVLPVVAVWLLWMIGPWLRALTRRGPVDQVLPRY